MSATTAQEVKRIPHSEDLLHPGDYVFVPRREPIVNIYRQPVPPPTGFIRKRDVLAVLTMSGFRAG
jgi:hypothetical protein